jgi:hypothetical protein
MVEIGRHGAPAIHCDHREAGENAGAVTSISNPMLVAIVMLAGR